MSTLLLLDDIVIGPADFDAWREEITGCACDLCSDANQARPLDLAGRGQLVACVVLLDALKSGRHVHVSYRQAAASARAKAIVNGTYGRTVIKFPMYPDGTRVGMTPGGVR